MTQRPVASAFSPAHLARIVACTAEMQWLSLVRYDQQSRWYRRLECTEDHEVWLLSWLPGQQTGFHDHGASAGAFTVALGSLSERGVAVGRPLPLPRTVLTGAVRAFGPGYVHDVRNVAERPAVSIHAYSPPLTSMRRFEVGSSGLLRATVEDRSW